MTTRGEDDEMTATDTMSTAVSERLQLSGERDQLKSMLLEDLRSHGWTESMFKAAAKAVAVHQVENETVATGPGKSSQALSACQLAELIAKPGHENVPDAVRARLLHKLVKIVRQFVAERDFQTVNPNSESFEKGEGMFCPSVFCNASAFPVPIDKRLRGMTFIQPTPLLHPCAQFCRIVRTCPLSVNEAYAKRARAPVRMDTGRGKGIGRSSDSQTNDEASDNEATHPHADYHHEQQQPRSHDDDDDQDSNNSNNNNNRGNEDSREMSVYRQNGRKRPIGELPFDVSVVSPPPRYLGRFQLDPQTHCGDIVEHDGHHFEVKVVRMRYRFQQGGFRVVSKAIEVKSLARKAIELYLEHTLKQS